MLVALAFATVLRPSHGYTSPQRLLLVLVLGAGIGLATLTAVAAGAALASRRSRRERLSLWEAMTVRNMTITLAVVVVAALSAQLLRTIGPFTTSQSNADAAAQADFRRWQEQVIPIAVTYMSALRVDRVLIHGLPRGAGRELRRRVARSEQSLTRLLRTLDTESPQLPARPELRRLTRRLAAALTLAVQAQKSYSLALAEAALGGGTQTERDPRIRRFVARGLAELQRSQTAMAAFSFNANNLGATLFAGSP